MRIALLALILSACTYRASEAENQARLWLESNYSGWPVNNVQCKWQDSDGDGYVRCNVSVAHPKTSDVKTPALECTYARFFTWDKGCQIPKGAQ